MSPSNPIAAQAASVTPTPIAIGPRGRPETPRATVHTKSGQKRSFAETVSPSATAGGQTASR